jgi:DNA-binding IclR family transcriptional regulator
VEEERTTRARGLSTARAVLRVLALLARSPEGLRADEVARALGKSPSTAYNLLGSLCEEGFAVHHHGRYRLADPSVAVAAAVAQSAAPLAGLGVAVDDLFARTHKRSYLAAVRGGRIVVPLVRGHQGMRRLPGLGATIGSNAHALALGKVALAHLDGPALERYIGSGLDAFTPDTIVDPAALRAELQRVRRDGLAGDREEFAADACCLAAPVHDEHGRAVAVLGISMPLRTYERDREELEGELREVAGHAEVPAIREAATRSWRATAPEPTVAALSAEMEVSA